jgi:hypothetical protein
MVNVIVFKKRMWCQMLVLTPVILVTWEAETERFTVQGQSQQIVHETPPHV